MGKRGPKKMKGIREANGRLDRKGAPTRKIDGMSRDEAAVIAPALAARERVWGVLPAVSRDQMAGSAIGRYCLTGHITRAQYDAGMMYLAEREDYSRSVQSPRQPGAVDLNATKGASTGQENVTRVLRIKAERYASDKAIAEAQREIGMRGNLAGALDAAIMNEVQLDHLVGDLRIALNALIRRYRLTEAAAA